MEALKIGRSSVSGLSVSSTTSSFVLRRRAHNADIWFFLLAPLPYRRPHRARSVSRAVFAQLDKLAGMRWHPTFSPSDGTSGTKRMLSENTVSNCQ